MSLSVIHTAGKHRREYFEFGSRRCNDSRRGKSGKAASEGRKETTEKGAEGPEEGSKGKGKGNCQPGGRSCR